MAYSMFKSVNVYGKPLAIASTQPTTGFFRDGYCNTAESDKGSHLIAGVVSPEFLAFSASRGNDLSPVVGKGGCVWCLCVARWMEALRAHQDEPTKYLASIVPRVKLDATHEKALDAVPLQTLEQWGIKENASKANGEL